MIVQTKIHRKPRQSEPRAPVPPALPALSEAEGSEAKGSASGPIHQFFNNLLKTAQALADRPSEVIEMAISISFSATSLEFSFLIRPNTEAILLTEGPVKAELLTEEVEESGESSGEAPTKAEDLGEEPLSFAEHVASAGFRSPSTRNALYKLHDRLTDGLDGEAVAEVEALLAEAVELAGELAAADQRPFGRSVEPAQADIQRGLQTPSRTPGTRSYHGALL